MRPIPMRATWRVLCAVALSVSVVVGSVATGSAPATAETVAAARQRLILAQTRVQTTTHRVTVRRQRLAVATRAVPALENAVTWARRQLRLLLRQVGPAHRRTAVAGQALARANVAVDEARRRLAEANAAMQRTARDAYMNASTASDLAMLLGFASDGPRGLSDAALRSLAVARVETRSVTDTRSAAEALAAAEAAAQQALADYQRLTSVEERMQARVSSARQALVTASAALQDARTRVTRLTAALARARRQDRRARVALRRATAAYRRAAGNSDTGPLPTPGAPPISTGNSGPVVWNTLRCNGFTEQAAAGVLGNLQQESNVDPTAVQSGGPGMGLAQWSRGGRWDTGPNSLLAFAAAHGLDPWDAATQTSFMLYEMQLGWGGFSLTRFRRMTDVVAATVYFHDLYERSADSSTFVAAVRGGYALQWYARLAGTSATC